MSLFNTLVPSFVRSAPVGRESDASSESTPAVRPFYRVDETPEGYALTVHLPGVTKDGLEITAEDGVVTVTGQRAWKQPEGWTALHRESAAAEARYELALTHDNGVDVDKIHAELTDGVLRVVLPKTEAIKPRKIAVN